MNDIELNAVLFYADYLSLKAKSQPVTDNCKYFFVFGCPINSACMLGMEPIYDPENEYILEAYSQYELIRQQYDDEGAMSFIDDICFIRAEKDKRTFFIDFIDKNKDIRNKPLIRYAEAYAFENLGMEEIFIQTKKENKRLINNIEEEKFDKLWEEHDIITFIKTKELDKEQGRVVHGTR